MEPTRAQLETFDVASKALEWAGVDGDATDENTLLGRFLKLVGATSTTPLVQLGGIPEEDWKQLINGWEIPTGEEGETQSPSLLLSSQFILFAHVSLLRVTAYTIFFFCLFFNFPPLPCPGGLVICSRLPLGRRGFISCYLFTVGSFPLCPTPCVGFSFEV